MRFYATSGFGPVTGAAECPETLLKRRRVHAGVVTVREREASYRLLMLGAMGFRARS
jgi:hypothetical protein